MLDQPPHDTMIKTPPAKKGFHFASDGIHFAEFIEAETIKEATAIYHKIKRPLTPTIPPAPAQSTVSPETEREDYS